MMIKEQANRFNVVACGRRFGKTQGGIVLGVETSLTGWPVGWFSPTYKMLAEIEREIVGTLRPAISRPSAQEHRYELATGGVIELWSLDSPDTARGRRYQRIIVDEAAMVKDLGEAWNAVLRPTLMDYEGDAWFFSTPRGRNFFYEMWQWGQSDEFEEWTSWSFPTLANPYIKPTEVEGLKVTMPERTYRQEILAEFLDDAGGVFRRVRENATLEPGTPSEETQYVFGVDWGKFNDFTVITVMDAMTKQVT